MRTWLTISILALLAPLASAQTTQPEESSPIAWRHGWSDDLFKEAKAEHKFVILDLEAIWCHWCHVMDVTTYQDPEVAKLMAEKYIAVKVDQDSRPDISNRYEDYGWPATVVFGEDGKEIAIRQGYIEPAQMISMLKAIIADPTPGPSVHALAPVRGGGPSLSADVRADLAKKEFDSYDEVYGSWGEIQKFMDWDGVEWSMSLAQGGPPDNARGDHMAKGTLNGQLNLIDPVWGGVYQYSVTDNTDYPHYETAADGSGVKKLVPATTSGAWLHAHFEKIMQMQAENMRTFANAYAMYHDPAYLKAAQAINHFLVNFLCSPDGAFYTSMDADLIDGVHSSDYFALDDAGRRKQGIPKVDHHIYARENGWTINGLCALYAATGDQQVLDEAIAATNWIIANRSIPGGGFRHGDADPAGPYLGDTLSMGRAMLSLYSVTGDRAWLARADSAASFVIAHFTASDYVGVATSNLTDASFRPRPELDENVMTARFGNLLYHYTGKAEDRKLAETAMRYIADPHVAESRYSMNGGMLLADAEMTSDPLHVTVVGSKSDATAKALFATAAAFYKPYKRLEWLDAAEGPLPNPDVPYPTLRRPAAFICTGSACSSPAYTVADLQRKLNRTLQH